MVTQIARAMYCALLIGLLAAGGAAAAQVPGDPKATCLIADRLIRDGHPQAALDRLAADTLTLMQSDLAPDGLVCPFKINAANLNIAEAQRLALEARGYLDDTPGTTNAPLDDMETAKELLAEALVLDLDNELATALTDDLPAAETVPESAASTWKDTRKSYLEPLTQVLVPLLGVLIALFLLARLATRIRLLVPKRPRKKWRGPVLALVTTLFAGAAAVGIVFWSDPPGTVPRNTVYVAAVPVLAVLAIGLGAYWLAGRLRILITCHDATGADDAAATGHLAALISELGGDGPRGVEIPRGSDVTALSGTPLGSTPEGRVAKLLLQLAAVATGAAPWKVLVEKVGDDALAVSVARNGRSVRSALVSPSLLGLTAPIPAAPGEDEDGARSTTPVDLYRVAAAIVVTALARSHGGFEELGDDPDWQSVGLQFVATTDLAHNQHEQQRVLALAVDLDDGNKTAYLSYLYSLERRAKVESELRAYADSLTVFLRTVADPDRYRQLRRRALHSRLASEINLYYATQESRERDQRAAQNLLTAAKELRDFHFKAPGGKQLRKQDDLLTRASEPAAAALLLWVHHTVCLGLLCDDKDHREAQKWLDRSASPRANYQAGCYFATAAPDVTTRSDAALTHLRRAVTDPELADWITQDPQLTKVLGVAPYRDYFRADPSDDLFALAPFAPVASRLTRLGITSADDVVQYSVAELTAGLSAPRRTCRRLLRLARAARYPIGEADNVYRVELCREAVNRGVLPPVDLPALVREAMAEGTPDLPDEPLERPTWVLQRLADKLRSGIDERCNSAPSVKSVERWLTRS